MSDPPSRMSSDLMPNDLASSEVGRQKVIAFIKSMQPVKFGGKQKKHISDFYKYYFTNFPALVREDIRTLLFGMYEKDKYLKGLIESCGNTNVKTMDSVKMSSVLALELLSMLLDVDMNRYAENFLDVLPEVPLKQLQAMKLGRHVLSDHGRAKREVACKVVYTLQQYVPEIEPHAYIHNGDALQAFEDWVEENIEKQSSESEEEQEPARWADVVLENPESELLAQTLNDNEVGEESSNVVFDPLELEGKFVIDMPKSKKRVKMARRVRSDSTDSEEEGGNDAGEFSLGDGSIQQGSISTSEEDFNPILFLYQVHRRTNRARLEQGLENLDRAINNRAIQLKQLVKDHFNEFVYCKDQVDTIHDLLQAELTRNFPGSKTGRMTGLLTELEDKSVQLFSNTLQRENEANRIRKVLHILKRFPVLFRLPGKIRLAMENEEYEKVVRAYKVALNLMVQGGKTGDGSGVGSNRKPNGERKTLMTISEGPEEDEDSEEAGLTIPQKIRKRIDELVETTRQKLLGKLDAPDLPLEYQQRVIGILIELDCKLDPAQYYLQKQKDSIMKLLQSTFDDYSAQLEPFRAFGNQGDDSVQDSKGDGLDGLGASTRDHLVSHVIKQLCSVFSRRMPDFAKLADSISTGKFSKTVQDSLITSPSASSAFDSKSARNKSGQSGSSAHMHQLIAMIVTYFAKCIRATVFPTKSRFFRRLERSDEEGLSGLSVNTASSSSSSSSSFEPHYFPLRPSMKSNVSLILGCYEEVKQLRLPADTCAELSSVVNDLLVHYVNGTFVRTFVNIKKLVHEETWAMHPDNKTITCLPETFAKYMNDTIQALEVIPSVHFLSAKVVECVVAPFLECMRALGDVLHALAFDPMTLHQYQQIIERLGLRTGSVASSSRFMAPAVSHADFTSFLAKRVLVVHGNVCFSMDMLLPAIWARFLELLPDKVQPTIQPAMDDILDLIDALEGLLVARYIRDKTLELNKLLYDGFFTRGIDWARVGPPKEIRSYVLQMLLQFVNTHHELSLICRDDSERIIEGILEALSAKIWEYVKEVEQFSTDGAVLLRIEVQFLAEKLSFYLDDVSEANFDAIEDYLLGCVTAKTELDKRSALRRGETVLKETLDKTRLLFQSFEPEDDPVDDEQEEDSVSGSEYSD